MAQHHQAFLDAGVRLFGVSVDRPGQHAAMVDVLRLPFPLLSDPDRSGLIGPLGLSNPDDPREIAIPATVLFTPDRQVEAWRWTSRDYADRIPESVLLDRVRDQALPPATQPAPELGPIEPGPKAVSPEWLPHYLRGARFAALAMGLRHRHLDESVKEDSKAYVAEMDRFLEALRRLDD